MGKIYVTPVPLDDCFDRAERSHCEVAQSDIKPPSSELSSGIGISEKDVRARKLFATAKVTSVKRADADYHDTHLADFAGCGRVQMD